MNLRDKVQAVLDSDISQYAISKRTGVSQGSLSALRSGHKEIGKLSLDVSQKLADFYDAAIMDLVAQDDESMSEFKSVLGQTFQELLNNQEDIANDDEGTEADRRVYNVLLALFQQTLDDNERLAQLLPYYN